MTSHSKVEVAKLFFEAMKTLKRSMRKHYEDFGLTLPQSFVMGTLMKFGEMKISELSQKLNLSNSTVSGIVDRLEKQQWVERTRSEEDRRVVYVNVSPKFQAIHSGIDKKVEELFEELLSKGTPEEIDKILEGLSCLNDVLNKHKES